MSLMWVVLNDWEGRHINVNTITIPRFPRFVVRCDQGISYEIQCSGSHCYL